MKKIRVLHLYKDAYPESMGGVAKFTNNLCKAGNLLGIENTVLAFSKKNKSSYQLTIDNYNVFFIPENFSIFSTSFSIGAFKKFKELVLKSDIIHYHFPYPFSDILNIFCGVRKPRVLTYHSDIVRQKKFMFLYRFLMNSFLNSVDYIVATSPNYLSTSKILKRFSNKVSVIPIGLSSKDYPAINNKIHCRYKQTLPERFFLFIGYFRYYKGLHLAFNAVKNTKINLVLAGDGEIKKDLLNKIKKENIQNITILDKISEEEKVSLLNLCTGFIFPSHLRSEAFGIALLEAALFGKPMVSCEIGTGTSFVNKDKITGLVVKPNSPIELRNAMQYLLDNEKASENMGKQAMVRAKELFNLKDSALSYLEVYKKLISRYKE